MTALVHVIPADQYSSWLTTQSNEINAANTQVTQLRQQLHSERKPLGDPKAPMSTSEYAVRPVPQVIAHEVTAPRQTKRWVDWLTTTDHKRIGIMYLVTTFVFFGLGGIEALLMRLQLGRPEQHPDHQRALQPAAHAPRHDDDLPVRGAGDGRVRQLLRAADDRRARHGVPAPERAVLLAAAVRRHRLLLHAVLPPARGRLVELSAALEHPVLAQRRSGRLDLPDPHHRHLVADRRDQLLRDDRQHARARA